VLRDGKSILEFAAAEIQHQHIIGGDDEALLAAAHVVDMQRA